MNQTIQNQIQQQFPFISKTIEVNDCKENIRVAQIVISDDKKYISFITNQKVEENNIIYPLKKVKLYHLETMTFLKQLEIKLSWDEFCFSKNSKIFIIRCIDYYILYEIESDLILRIETKVRLSFSYDSSKYVQQYGKTINLLGHQYYNVKNSLWQFSQQNNQFISFRQRNNQRHSLQYRRIKHKKLKITLDIKITNAFQGLYLKFFEWFVSRVILLYSVKFIKIYNLRGKLIRNIILTNMNAESESINVHKDQNGKPILVNVFSPYQAQTNPYKTIVYVSLLPEVKIYMNEIKTEYLICFNINGVISFQTNDLQAKKGTISYLE